MEKKEILSKLQEIFRDVMDNEDIILEGSTTAEDIEEWDSLSHVQVVDAAEKKFGVKFTSYEITSWIDVEELVDCIAKKLNG